jgi:triacylglycerol esterase/lipase EstA (alpha/beta hydrolase family)
MSKVVQNVYAQPETPSAFKKERLVIHQRNDPSKAKHLAIFVHGLGGARYGKHPTWGGFPGFMFEDFPTVDIGMYYYRTLFRRLAFWRSIRLDEEAVVLGDFVRASTYPSIVLLGHSMGGLLCKGAVAHLASTNQTDAIDKISGIFFLASPQLGSTKVLSLLSWMTKDTRVLKVHSQYLTTIEQVFREHIHCGLSISLDDKRHIPCWALVGALSAGIGLGVKQKLTLGKDHWDIVKPDNKDDEGYRFVNSAIQRAIVKGERQRRRSECKRARFDDLLTLNEMAKHFFGEDVSNLMLMRDWVQQNQDVFWTLRRITSSPDGHKYEEVVGYLCLIPVDQGTSELIRGGKVKVAHLPARSILPSDKPVHSVYIGAVVGTDMRSRAEITVALTTRLYALAGGGRLEVLTRPITDDGLRMVEDYEMTPVSESGLGQVYEFVIEEK